MQILLALWHVHGKNVLHRDLKSQNIFMTEGVTTLLRECTACSASTMQSTLDICRQLGKAWRLWHCKDLKQSVFLGTHSGKTACAAVAVAGHMCMRSDPVSMQPPSAICKNACV